MKKILLLAVAFSLILSACALPSFPQVTAPPAPDLVGTADVFVQQTLLAQPTPTVFPTDTPVISTPTLTAPPPTETGTPTETQNPSLLTLTATLGTGTPAGGTGTTASLTPTGTRDPSIGATPTRTAGPLFFGTVPPDPPSGSITLLNKSRAEAYISLQCEDRNGKVTILEYPVRRQVRTKAPAGDYLFVAWVGGRQMTGTF
ncbi:MAG: hypothetical protein AB1649_06515, partial [Chloroflexota bacterium]